MTKPDSLLFSLQKLIVDFSLINRNHYLAQTNRRENDSEHSISVALLCWYIHDKYKINLDIAKILKYSISHDFVEVHAGDTNRFASELERQQKVNLEHKSLERLSNEFRGFEDMVGMMKHYETKRDEEALFVWTVDKMQTLIMGDMDSWRPYQELDIGYETFCKKYQELLSKCSPYCQEIFETLIDHCKSTYYDNPTGGNANKNTKKG